MQLNPSEISEIIKEKISGANLAAEATNQGTVVTVTDGICKIHGLSDVMQGEMLEFPNNTFGLALNLERDSVGAVILGDYEQIAEGDVVKCTGKILEVPVGAELIGRVVNALGQPIVSKGVWLGKIPSSPSTPGTTTKLASPENKLRSADTISNRKVFALENCSITELCYLFLLPHQLFRPYRMPVQVNGQVRRNLSY